MYSSWGTLGSGVGGVVIIVGRGGAKNNDLVASKVGACVVGLLSSDFLAALGAPGSQRC